MIDFEFKSVSNVAALAMLAALSGCNEENVASAQAAPPMGPPVSVAVVGPAKAVPDLRSFSGRVEAMETAQLRPRVSGTIESVHLKPGSLVKKGDVLMVIDPRPYQVEVVRLEAAAASSKAKLELAQTELARSKRLLDENAIAQRDYDERAANTRQLEASARADQAAIQAVRLNLEWSTVRAPFDGRVGKAEVTTGNLVDRNTVLTNIVSASPMYVSFNIDESTFLQMGKAARSNPGALKIRAALANEQGFPHEGRLEFIDNQIDRQAGSVRMRAVVDNRDGMLTPGLFAKVQIDAATADVPPSILVAERAVGTDQNRKFVFVVGANNQAEYRPVQLGTTVGELRVVTVGLKEGERVVVDGLQRVRPGAPITPQIVSMETDAGVTVAEVRK